jgi:hypothetical protein
MIGRVASVFIALGFLAACAPSETRRPAAKNYIPHSEQVALVNGEPLTVDSFMVVHQALGSKNPDQAYWISTAALALRTALGGSHPGLSLAGALDLAMYASGHRPLEKIQKSLESYRSLLGLSAQPDPDQVRKFLDRKLSSARIIRNETIWAGLFPKNRKSL